MISTRKPKTLAGLDIEAGSVAAAEVRANGSVQLGAAGVAPLDAGISREGEVLEPEALADALRGLFAERKLPRTVRAGIANQRVVVRTIRLPLLDKRDEIETAIRFQATDQIPMPLDQAVLDWQVLEQTPATTAEGKMDVVVVAARRESVSGIVRACRLAGLKLVGIDAAAFGMIRALAEELPTAAMPALSYEERIEAGEGPEMLPPEPPARLLCNLGDVTNLAVASGSRCLFTRISPFGVEAIAIALAEQRGLTLEHARRWLVHVGLERPVEEIEGDPAIVAAARESLVDGAARLAGELRLSLDYYGSQEGAVAIDGIVLCGAGTAIEGFAPELERSLGYALQVARPAPLADLGELDAARLTLPYGLALEG